MSKGELPRGVVGRRLAGEAAQDVPTARRRPVPPTQPSYGMRDAALAAGSSSDTMAIISMPGANTMLTTTPAARPAGGTATVGRRPGRIPSAVPDLYLALPGDLAVDQAGHAQALHPDTVRVRAGDLERDAVAGCDGGPHLVDHLTAAHILEVPAQLVGAAHHARPARWVELVGDGHHRVGPVAGELRGGVAALDRPGQRGAVERQGA